MTDQRPEPEQRAGHNRVLGLAPKARRAVLWLLLLAVIAVPLSYGIGRASGRTPLGGDLAVLAAPGSSASVVMVGGEWGAVRGQSDGRWQPVESLAGKDVMAWASTGDRVLAGAHQGLYVSNDRGSTFASTSGIPIVDVHGLGAAGQTVYVTAPDGTVWRSDDGGVVFGQVGRANASFMGSIWVDPTDPAVAVAPSMDYGAMRTSDGGVNWRRLGGPSDAMSVTVDPTGRRIVVVGMHDAQVTADGGRSWSTVRLPAGTLSASFDRQGMLLTVGWEGDRVAMMRQTGASWTSLGTTSVS